MPAHGQFNTSEPRWQLLDALPKHCYWCAGPLHKAMPDTKTDGTKIFIDRIVMEQAEALQPRWMSRTAWITYLVEQACHELREKDHIPGTGSDYPALKRPWLRQQLTPAENAQAAASRAAAGLEPLE